MPKNLIFVHLESISNTILWQYRVELHTIWEMMRHCLVYNHFYSSATSTVMARKHLLTGTACVNDGVSVFGQHYSTTHPANQFLQPTSLWSALFFAGYGKNNRIYVVGDRHYEPPIRFREELYRPDITETLPYVRSSLAQAKADGIPFLYFLRPMISHITGEDKVKLTAKTFTDRFRLGYIRLNDMVAFLMATLVDLQLLDNSLVVFYGDHGDELWSHGLVGGWCHTYTPYASQCWSPLFIYDKDRPPGTTNQLASMVDLRETLVKRLLPDFDPEKVALNATWSRADGEIPYFMSPVGEYPSLPKSGTLPPFRENEFNGIDLERETRELAFSQTLFAMQLQFNDESKVLAKAYAVTDGIYRVTVTAGGEDPRDGGLEFFCDQIDPTNGRSLLDFFSLDANGYIKDLAPPPEVNAPEFYLVFNPEAVEHLKATFNHMRRELYEYIRKKEALAKPRSIEPTHSMPESVFNHALKRPYKDQPPSDKFEWKP